jgi:steroid delta-isomerase-like uncharacterized protein
MSTETNKAVVRRFHEALDRGDMTAMENLLAPDLKSYEPGLPQPLDREAFKQFGQVFLTAFGDSQSRIESQVAEGEWVATRGTWSATHKGDFNGIPATGNRIHISTVIFDRLINGKIVEHRAFYDTMAMMQQLGVIPTRA